MKYAVTLTVPGSTYRESSSIPTWPPPPVGLLSPVPVEGGAVVGLVVLAVGVAVGVVDDGVVESGGVVATGGVVEAADVVVVSVVVAVVVVAVVALVVVVMPAVGVVLLVVGSAAVPSAAVVPEDADERLGNLGLLQQLLESASGPLCGA